MGEAIWCNVKVRVPPLWMEPCIEAMDGVLINGDGFDDRDPDARTIELHWNGEGNYGLWDDGVENFLTWCEEFGVPYYASSDPKYEYEGEVRIHDGVRVFKGAAFSEEAALTLCQYQAIVSGMSQFHSVEQYFELMNTYDVPAPAKQLGDFPPPNADDRTSYDNKEF